MDIVDACSHLCKRRGISINTFGKVELASSVRIESDCRFIGRNVDENSGLDIEPSSK